MIFRFAIIGNLESLRVHMSVCWFCRAPAMNEKTYKITCAANEESSQPAYLYSLISLSCPHEESLCHWLTI